MDIKFECIEFGTSDALGFEKQENSYYIKTRITIKRVDHDEEEFEFLEWVNRDEDELFVEEVERHYNAHDVGQLEDAGYDREEKFYVEEKYQEFLRETVSSFAGKEIKEFYE